MFIKRPGIALPVSRIPQQTETQLKSVALSAFRFLRLSAIQAQRLPGLAQQAGQVIAEAWYESALPKH